MIQKVLIGFTSPARGLKIIFSSPKSIAYSFIPFFIGLLVLLLGYFAASQYIHDWVAQITANSTFFQSWGFLRGLVDILLILLSWILVSLLNFLAGYLCVVIVAGPFYALMVENIFKKELPDKEKRGNLRLAFNMFYLGLVKAVIFVVVGILCFILAFIPPFNFVTPLILVLTVAFDVMDYSFEVDFLTLRQRFRFFRRHFPYFLGLGFAILLTGLIPGSFFVLLPAFICGATQIYIQLRSDTV